MARRRDRAHRAYRAAFALAQRDIGIGGIAGHQSRPASAEHSLD
jgi:hypothetical protein